MKVLVTYGQRPPYPPFGWQLAKAFRALGQTAIFLPLRDRPWWGTAIKRAAPRSWKRHWQWDQAEWANRLVLKAVARYRPDLLVEIEGDLFTCTTLQTIKRTWGTRLGVSLVEGPCGGKPPPALAEYERIVSTSRIAVEQLRHAGLSSVEYLPLATDPEWFRPSPKGFADQAYPVGFVGAYSPKRARVLESMIDLGLHFWGSDWDTRYRAMPLLAALRAPRGVFGRELLRCYQWSKICLSIQREHMITHDAAGRVIGTGLGSRHFDIPACGSFLMSERVLELPDAFTPGQEIEVFESLGELREKTLYLLSHETRRQRMVQRARQRVLQEHTYLHRARKWIEWYERFPTR